ncbi:efflux RND transporter periplasmic adaptor subunit [Cypionkella sp.]|uniref:efflux RND transporter periplasmic adaptor subunit n=1 Tax=Cypionkella sp. TaxID=2811411 RepID=UPI00375200FB
MKYFTTHRMTAIVVLIVAAAWVITGKFSSVGSEAKAQEEAPAAAEAPAVVRRTVAAVAPIYTQYAREIRLSGVTEADKQAVLAARSSGIVAKLGAQQGQDVSSDTLILQLEGDEVIAGVETAKAALAQAKEKLSIGETLFKKGSLAEFELTSRRAAASAAEGALAQAEAALDRLQLKAPFAGTVDSVAVEIGESVQSGAPIATLLALDPIVIKAEVSERDVGFVSTGSRAMVRLVNGVEMEGIIRHVAMQASPVTRTFAVEVALPNADRKIPSGMTAEVRLYADKQEAVFVSRSIITISDTGDLGLRVVGGDNIADFAKVSILDDGEQGLVVTGVPKDKLVIVAGQDLVSNGDLVEVKEMTVAEAAKALK